MEKSYALIADSPVMAEIQSLRKRLLKAGPKQSVNMTGVIADDYFSSMIHTAKDDMAEDEIAGKLIKALRSKDETFRKKGQTCLLKLANYIGAMIRDCTNHRQLFSSGHYSHRTFFENARKVFQAFILKLRASRDTKLFTEASTVVIETMQDWFKSKAVSKLDDMRRMMFQYFSDSSKPA